MRRSSLAGCLAIAIRNFDKHPAFEFRHWSFVYQDGKLLSVGMNRSGYSNIGLLAAGYKEHRYGVHAEPVAIKKALGLLDRRRSWQLVNVRLTMQLIPTMSKPCLLCQAFSRACGCSSVWFTDADGDFARLDL